jgi:putative tricarboxylic transport membrane protein
MRGKVVPEIRDQEGFWAGIFFVAAGIGGLWLSQDYPVGTTISMGPGYLPRLLCCGLILLGSIIAILGVSLEGRAIRAPDWRPLTFVVAAILAFGLVVQSYGLVLASIASAGLTVLANRERVRPLEAILLLVLLTTFTVVLFVYLLQQPIRVWWWEL